MPPLPNNKRKRTQDKPVGRGGGKRSKEDLEAAVQDPVQQEASLKSYMFHANKLLHKACKKAKTFELQKLTRKIKTTREPKDGKPVDEAILADLEAQLVALKALSIDSIPSQLLSTRLPKHPSLRSLSFLPSILASIPSSSNPNDKWSEVDGQSSEGKARNRVMANKSLGEGWEEIVRGVRKRLGEVVEPPSSSSTKKGVVGGEEKGKEKEKQPATEGVAEGTLKEEGNGERRLSKRAERAKRAEETKKNLPKRSMEMSEERKAAIEALERSAGRQGRDGDGDGNEGDTEEEEEEGSEDEGPVAGSEDEELDDDEIERELAAMNEGLEGSEGEWSGSEDDDEGGGGGGFESDSSFPAVSPADDRPTKRSKLSSPSEPKSKSKKTREIPTHKPVTSSAFLPSLAAGYVSYSDSDGEDAKWVKAAERENKKGERKNRRGQRARQAIWEKKYGSAAAHVVKAQGGKPLPVDKLKKNKKAIKAGESVPSKVNNNNKTDSAAVEETPFNPANAPGGSANPNAQPIAPRKGGYGSAATNGTATTTTTGEKMHPSWEAKRKQAEALKSVQPQGKKITFD
ncbi:BUD22 family protein [Sporobolomyces salmoneus]|uniref:BUD22 family protein n=1 Tax=Sporobolomyces salmoneus TaxID=183962 RepID=UPI0031736805